MNFNQKYRPTSINECLFPDDPGTAQIIRDIANNTTDQNVLLSGPMGTGKSLFARLIAEELDRRQIASFLILQGTSLRTASKADEAIERIDKISSLVPISSTRHLFVIDEFDRVHRDSQLSFGYLFDRKDTQFILTTNYHNLIDDRIVSRTLSLKVSGAAQEDMTRLAMEVFAKEGVEASAAEVSRLVLTSNGNVRDLLTLVEGRVMQKRAANAAARKTLV